MLPIGPPTAAPAAEVAETPVAEATDAPAETEEKAAE